MIVTLDNEYLESEIAVPVGDYMYWGRDLLRSRWSAGKFQVYLYDRWLTTEREYFKQYDNS